MSRQIKRHREALLPGCDVGTIEFIGFFRGGEAGILADGPRAVGVHCCVGAAIIGFYSLEVIDLQRLVLLA
jgi:hypothetical protein